MLARKQSFWLMSLAAACSSMIGYGMFFWLPSFFVRSFDLSLVDASLFYGGILLVGGLAGTWLGGSLADRFGIFRRTAYVLIPALAFLATVPFFVFAILSSKLLLTFFLMLIPTALGLAWLGPVLSAIQHVVPPNMRATASAIFLFIINLIGLGAGTVMIGALSDFLQARLGDDSLRYAMLVGTSLYFVAAALLFLSARRLDKDWEG